MGLKRKPAFPPQPTLTNSTSVYGLLRLHNCTFVVIVRLLQLGFIPQLWQKESTDNEKQDSKGGFTFKKNPRSDLCVVFSDSFGLFVGLDGWLCQPVFLYWGADTSHWWFVLLDTWTGKMFLYLCNANSTSTKRFEGKASQQWKPLAAVPVPDD